MLIYTLRTRIMGMLELRPVVAYLSLSCVAFYYLLGELNVAAMVTRDADSAASGTLLCRDCIYN